MCRYLFTIALPLLLFIAPAAAQDDRGAWLEVGEGLSARIAKERGVTDDDLPDGSKRVSKTYRLEVEGEGHLGVLLPYEPTKLEDPARLRVAVVSGSGVTYHPCRVRPEMKSVQFSAADLPASRSKAQREHDLNSLESEWTENRNKAQLVGNQIMKLLAQHGLSRDTHLLEYEAVRERNFEVRRELLRTTASIRLLTKLGAWVAEGATEDEDAREVRKELWTLQQELARRVKELGPMSPVLRELKAKIKMLESRGEFLQKLKRSRLDEKLAELGASQGVQQVEIEELDRRLQELGKLKRRVAALTRQQERYEAEAENHYRRWERLQSEQSSPGSARVLLLTVVEKT